MRKIVQIFVAFSEKLNFNIEENRKTKIRKPELLQKDKYFFVLPKTSYEIIPTYYNFANLWLKREAKNGMKMRAIKEKPR